MRRLRIKKESNKLPLLIAIIGVVGTIIAVLIQTFFPIVCSKTNFPEFSFVNNQVCYHPDSSIYVQAINKAAKQNEHLSFEIDSVFQYQEGKLNDHERYLWQIDLHKDKLPDFVYCAGEHRMCFGFSREYMSKIHKIYFDDKNPNATVEVKSKSKIDKKIFGIIHDDNPVIDQDITVELAFKCKNEMLKVEVPVKDSVDSDGRQLKVFRYFIQNIPQIAKTDPDYKKDFFACKIKDEAGNTIPYKSTYNAFISEGRQTFGFQNATVLMKKVNDIEQIAIKRKSNINKKIKQIYANNQQRNFAREWIKKSIKSVIQYID